MPTKSYLRFQRSRMPTFLLYLATQSPQITSRRLETSLLTHLLLVSWKKGESRRRISTLTEPGEATIWSWPEGPLLTSGSLTKWWRAKLDQKQFTYQRGKYCPFLMLLRNINNKDINLLSLVVNNMVLARAEIGLPKGPTCKESRLWLLRVSRGFIGAT